MSVLVPEIQTGTLPIYLALQPHELLRGEPAVCVCVEREERGRNGKKERGGEGEGRKGKMKDIQFRKG